MRRRPPSQAGRRGQVTVFGPPNKHLVFGSIVTKSHVAAARALSRTVHTHHPDATHFIVVVDLLSSEPLPETFAGERYVALDVLLEDSDERRLMAFRYEAFELCCALKPLVLKWLLENTG